MAKLGVWAHPTVEFTSVKEIEKRVAKLADVGISIIASVIKDTSGLVNYPSKIAPVSDFARSFDFLKPLIKVAKEYEVEVYAWSCVLAEGRVELGGILAKRPELAMIDSEGKRIGWACPSHEEVREYEVSIFREVLESYEVDGIHLDYIRYPSINACSCDRCGKIDPLNEEWVMARVNYVTSIVEMARDLAREYGVKISAAVIPVYPESLITFGQDWVDWCNRGLLDWVAPMNYSNVTKLVEQRTRLHRFLVKTQLLEGIGKKSSMSFLTPEKLLEQILRVLSLKADGVMIFSLSGMTDEDFKIIKERVRKN